MGWESFKMMLCPFCENGRVKVRHVPALKKETLARGSAVSKRTTPHTQERYSVLEDCPSCGASKKKFREEI
jgi:rubredoxin